MHPKLLTRAGLASAPLTAFAPAAGAALTGSGALWLALPLGSVAAVVAGNRSERRAAQALRRGVIVADPAPDANGVMCATAPRDLVTVEYVWSDEAA